jgi:hypothetical protein
MNSKKLIVIILGIAIVAGGIGFFLAHRRTSVVSSTTPPQNTTAITVGSDVCSEFPKEWVQQVTGKTIIKAEAIASAGTNVCQYYVDENNFLTLRLNNLSVEDQKKGQQTLGRTITTNDKITIENFIAVQPDGLINGVYLVINPNEFLAVDRTSTKALSEEEIIRFAQNVAEKIHGKKNTESVTPTPTQKSTAVVPLPQETDIIRSFFGVIGEHRPADAVLMLAPEQISNDSNKQAWAVQFNAFSTLKVTSVEAALQEDWTDTQHEYKVILEASMKPESASAPIPYYGWENGSNTRWIMLVKSGNLWKISGIGTGP